MFTSKHARTANKKYAHVPLNDATSFQNDFQSGYENQFQNDIVTTHSNPPSLLRNFQLRWWCWELVAAAISIVLFAAVVIVLKVYDGHALPQLPGDITLNTTISLIAAVSKTALLLVASAFMSQYKWLWIHKRSRKLQELQAFDEASRGPWGALTLLQHSRVSVASLGALLTLLTLGFDPFVQQLITTPQRDLSFEAGSTAVSRASTFNQSALLAIHESINDTLSRLDGFNPYSKLQMTVSNGASSQGDIDDFAISCPTANCTWPSFKSLGVCSTCMNVTEYAKKNWNCQDGPSHNISGSIGNNRTCSYNLPNSAFSYEYEIFSDDSNGNYTEVAGELRLNIWTTSKQNTSFSDNTFLLVSLVALENTADLVPGPAREQVLEATECALAMCVEEHELLITMGIMSHKVTSTEQPFSMKVHANSTSYSGTSYDVKSAEIDNVVYSVDGIYTLFAVMQDINSTLISSITADYTTTSKPGSAVQYDGSVTPSSPLATSFFAGLDFTQAVENMVTSLSQYIRSLSNDTTVGRAHQVEIYVHVKWNFIAFPVVLVVGGVALLVIAIMQTNQNGLEVWKSSSLPLWFHGPQTSGSGVIASENRLERVNTLLEMEGVAEQTLVSLVKLDDGRGAWKLLPVSSGPESDHAMSRIHR